MNSFINEESESTASTNAGTQRLCLTLIRPELRAAIREYEKGRTPKRSLNREEAIIRTPEELFASLICD